jgi:hypothetical protein
MLRAFALTSFVASLPLAAAHAQDLPTLEIVWPKAGSIVELGDDVEKAVGIVVQSNHRLRPAGGCGAGR